MKKKYAVMMLAAAVLTLTACGKKEVATEENTSVQESSDEAEESTPVLYEDLTSTIVKLADYKGVQVAKNVREVTDEEVQKEIRATKNSYGELKDVDRAAQSGDVVVIDFTGYVDGETSDSLQGTEYSLELGSGTFVPGFEDQLIGALADEDREVNVTFPEDYYEDMAGKEARFDVHVHKVQAYEVEGWGDDFVKENMGYESIADMETKIREELESAAEEEAEANLDYELVEKVLADSEYEVTDADVEAYVEEMLGTYRTYAKAYGMELEEFLQQNVGSTEAQLREMFREPAAFRVQMTLTFHEIAKQEGLEISEEEYQERLETLAAQYGYEDVAQVEEQSGEEMIREQMLQEKAIALIRENAVIE